MKSFIFTLSLFIFSLSLAVGQNHSNTAYLGIQSNTVSNKKAQKLGFEKPYGAYITKVIENTSADRAGLQPFDYIYQIGDYEFGAHTHLKNVLDNFQAGNATTLYYVRNGENLSQAVVLGNKSDSNNSKRDRDEDPFLGVEDNHDNLPSNVNGVRVNVVENSTAERMGLEDGDIITKIDRYPILDWHDLGAAIDAREVGDKITVSYLRGNKMTVFSSPIISLAETKGETHYKSPTYSYSYSYNTWSHHHSTPQKEDVEIQEDQEIEPMIAMEIEMEDMPQEDAEMMKEELDIDMPVVQNLQIEQLNIFPNPTEGMFNLKFELLEEGATAIRIMDVSGRLIFTSDLGNFSGKYSGSFDLGNQPAGTYFVMIQQGRLSISKKVVVSRR